MEDAIQPSDFPVGGVQDIIDRLPKYFTCSVASKRNSGKSVLVMELIKDLMHQKKVDMVIVMSGSAHLNNDYKFLPQKLVMPFNERILGNVWYSQTKKDAKDRKHILFVFDDCLSTPEAIRNPLLTRIYVQGRHVAVSGILISQHTASLLSPTIKGNSDIILWSQLGRSQLQNLADSTTNITTKNFVKLSEALGGHDFQFLLLDNYNRSTDPREFLAVVKAKPPKEK